MLKHLLRTLLPLVLALSYGLEAAQAAIYTWTDASGRVNVSNLAPPEGTRVTSVVPESPAVARVRPSPTMRRAGSKCRPWPTASGNSRSKPSLRNLRHR